MKLNILIWLIEMFQFCLLPCPTNHSSVLVWFTEEYQQNNGYNYNSQDIAAMLVKIFHFLGSAFQRDAGDIITRCSGFLSAENNQLWIRRNIWFSKVYRIWNTVIQIYGKKPPKHVN